MKLHLREKIIFSFGNLGIALITVIHMLFLVYVFFPANNSGLGYVIPQENIFLGITILGIILFASRLFDIITDPIVAHLSDNSKNIKGKRLPFMAKSAIPMGVIYVAVFFIPITDGIRTINIIWVGVTLILSALFLTLYSIPYYTLMVEMAKLPEDKIDLGTYSSAFWFLGFLIVSFATLSWEMIEKWFGCSRLMSIQISFVVIAFIGIVCLFIPVLFLDEKKYVKDRVLRNLGIRKSILEVGKNKSFVVFIISNIIYGVSTYIFETGLIFYITVLALKNEGIQGPLTTVIGILTLLSYPLINKLAKKSGKKVIMIIGFILFGLTFMVIAGLGMKGLNVNFMLGIIAVLAPFSQAAFGILPGVITADCADYDRYKSGVNKSGMYMAVNVFSQKVGGTIATIIFTGFLLLGKDVRDDLGIRLAVIFAAVICIMGVISIFKYDEKEILSYAEEYREKV